MSSLEANLQSVRDRIAEAAIRVNRSPAEIALVAVTKSQPPEVIREAYNLGLRCFGENRVEEAHPKIASLPGDISWHMIGHIQSRKAKSVVSNFDMVHSVDRLKLARRLSNLRPDGMVPLPVLLEFNVTGEPSKDGFAADRWAENATQRSLLIAEIGQILMMPGLDIRGLMTMAPIVPDPEEARPAFAQLRNLRDELVRAFPNACWEHMSMGMTDDFEVAIEEGATMVRVGRAIFAPGQLSWCRV